MRAYYAEHPGTMPPIAAQRLGLPETVIVSALPAEQAVSAPAAAFAEVWAAMGDWEAATFLIMKGANVFEIASTVGDGKPSNRSAYYNIAYEQPVRGHLRPDLYTSMSAVAMPGRDGAMARGVLFYGPDRASVFGVFLAGEGANPKASEVAKFDKVMQLVASKGPLCGAQVAPGGVVVFGASGRTGAMVVDELLAKGEAVTAFVRPTSERTRLAGRNIGIAIGDAMNADDVDAAIAAAKPRVVINTIGGRGTQFGFWNTTQMNMTAAAKKHGAKEVIFLSSVGVGDSAQAYSAEARERTKVSMAERLIAEEDLKASGVDYVIIRTGIIAPEGSKATGKAKFTEDPTVLSPVTRADLAKLTVDCIGNAECRNKTFATMDDTLSVSR